MSQRTSFRDAGRLEFVCGGVVDAVVHDAVLVELDLVDLDARHVVLPLAVHLGQVERLAALVVVVLRRDKDLPSSIIASNVSTG